MRSTSAVTGTGGAEAIDGRAGLRKAPGSWLRERAWLLDLLVALAVFTYNMPIAPMYATGPVQLTGLMVISTVLCGSQLLRRRYPLAVFGVALLAACAQLPLDAPIIAADLMLLFAVYNVAARFRWEVSLPGAVAVIGWLLAGGLPRLGHAFLDIGQLGLLVVTVAWVWTWGTLVRIRRDYIASLQERARQLEREQDAQARMAVAGERARIAREIHDIVSHGLSVVVVMSEGAAAKVDDEPERARSAMLTVRDTGRGALVEMRRMLGVLRDGEPGSHAPQPGIAELGRLVEESRTAGLPVELAVSGEPVPVPPGPDLAVYRVVQEALTNARKHAGPSLSRVEVWLRYGDAEVEVRVADDGRGYGSAPEAQRSEQGGHGLLGMRERVAAYGGTLRTGMRPGGGFEVSAVLPVGGGR